MFTVVEVPSLNLSILVKYAVTVDSLMNDKSNPILPNCSFLWSL